MTFWAALTAAGLFAVIAALEGLRAALVLFGALAAIIGAGAILLLLLIGAPL